MSKIKPKELLIPVVVLSVIALICGALLGAFHMLTEVDQNAEALKAVAEHYPQLELVEQQPDMQGLINEVNAVCADIGQLYTVIKCKDGTYIFRSAGKGGYGGDVVLLVPIKDGIIGDIVVFENSETAGVGSNALPPNEGYIGQYIGADVRSSYFLKTLGRPFGFSDNKAAGKVYNWFDGNGSDGGSSAATSDGSIVALTGATKTSTAVLNSINVAATAYLRLSEVQNG